MIVLLYCSTSQFREPRLTSNRTLACCVCQMDKGHLREGGEGGRPVSNQGNGVDEFRSEHAVAGVTQLGLRFNWHLNSVFAHVRVYDRNILTCSSMCTSRFPKNTMKTTINQRDRGRSLLQLKTFVIRLARKKPDSQQIPASSARVPTVPPNGAAFHTVSPTDKPDFSS